MAPYVAAVVSRSDLRQWALDIGADKDAGVLAKDPTAILSLLGQAMSDPSLVYAAARKKRKGKGSTTPSPRVRCRERCEDECGSVDNCCGLDVVNGMCTYECCDDIRGTNGGQLDPAATQGG